MNISKEQLEKLKYNAYLLLLLKDGLKKGSLLEREEKKEDFENELDYFNKVCNFLNITFDFRNDSLTISDTKFMYILKLKSAQTYVNKYIDKIFKN